MPKSQYAQLTADTQLEKTAYSVDWITFRKIRKLCRVCPPLQSYFNHWTTPLAATHVVNKCEMVLTVEQLVLHSRVT